MLLKLTSLKLTSLKLTILVLLLTWVNAAALAQQKEEQTSATQATADVKSESASEPKPKAQNHTPPVPLPAPLTQQYKADLSHYLSAEQVKPLLAGPDDYITLITENASVNSRGVAILLPDWQQSATNPKAINFLRKQLPLQGWTTITVQPASMPENYPSKALKVSEQRQENNKIIDDYQIKFNAMINAVIDKVKGYPGIAIVIAQGNNAALLVNCFDSQASNQNNIKPNAVILLSSYLLTNPELIDEANTDFAKKIAASQYPVLDLYLTQDHPIVLDKAKQRLALSKKAMKVYYRQRQLNSMATGYYPEPELLTQINGWLKAIGW